MRKHRGMRPQDIVVLLKILSMNDKQWKVMNLSVQLSISQSEISEALNRNKIAQLIDAEKRHVHRQSLVEFLIHGLRFVFPEQPGAIVRGMPTAHSAAPLKEFIQQSEDIFVWPDPNGEVRGQAIEPLYKTVPKAAKDDLQLYQYLALVDAIRVGRARERKLAEREIKQRVLQ